MSESADELTAKEAAQLLGVGRDTILRYYQRGLLPGRGIPLGLRTRYWFKRADVEALKARLAHARKDRNGYRPNGNQGAPE